VLDLYVRRANTFNINKETAKLYFDDASTPEVRAVLNYIIENSQRLLSSDTLEIGIKLLVPYGRGYLVQADFIQRRMLGCALVQSCAGFLSTNSLLHYYNPATIPNLQPQELIEAVAGAILIKSDSDVRQNMALVNEEIAARLSLAWIAASPLLKNRLVIVASRHPLVMADWLRSAYGLGIRITLVGPEGHFLQHHSAQYPAIEQYLPIDMNLDDGLAQRILTVLKNDGRPFHGITTFKDPYFIYVAEVAKALGLHTEPIDAIKTCIDKHSTSQLIKHSMQPVRVKNLEELKDELTKNAVTYPLIVKPCNGYGSEGVFRADAEDQLYVAVLKLKSTAEGDVLIDTFVEGPEVDCNFVLLHGEVLFFEVVDGFPCTAEDDRFDGGDFLETDQVWPSNHPAAEKELLRRKLHEILVRLGLQNGVFHIEARVINSEVEYNTKDGIIDLRPHHRQLQGESDCFLIEINVRPPGHGGFTASKWAYGIDYLGLYSLCALRADEQMMALAQPYAFAEGAQGWCNTVFINAEKPGIFNGEDIPQQVSKIRPDLMAYVAFGVCYYKRGDVVTDNPPRIALFVVTSHSGRKHVRDVAQAIRETAQPLVRMQHDSI